MSYIVFARKYRPQAFDDIIGQSHITTTLKNAISQDRVAHAYIFAGPRGVGKTTTARILGKALNCEKGPTPTPCGKCATCQEMARSSSLDLIEIDGASNRGIDEIRSLRENVKFAPSRDRFKIYIIDEVHMLTEPAFNALLKTLEEPPPHVKFIFATTQAYKIPATILSRCQRFDFRRLSSKDISDSLKKISRAEHVDIDDEALELLAKHSDGSMRDAQVMLDQITSFADGRIGRRDVSGILGLVSDEILFNISEAINKKDAAAALSVVDSCLKDGKDILQLVFSLIEHFRNMAVAKIGEGSTTLIDAGPDRVKRYVGESQKFTTEEILYIIYSLSNTIDFIRKSNLPRIPLEAALIKLAQAMGVMPLAEIVKKLNASGCAQAPVVSNAVPKPETPTMQEQEKSSAQLEDILAGWAGVINYIKAKKISIASYLEEGYPVGLESRTISIGFPKEFQFHKEVLESTDNRRLIEEGIKAALGRDLKVSFTLVAPMKMKDKSQGGGYLNTDGDDEGSGGGQADPIVKTALEIFGGEVAGESKRRIRYR